MTDKIIDKLWLFVSAFFTFAFVMNNRAENELQAGVAMVCAVLCFATHSILTAIRSRAHD